MGNALKQNGSRSQSHKRKSLLQRLGNGASRRLVALSKALYRHVRWRNVQNRTIVFIVGCQRSGTTLMTELFEANRAAVVFGEFSRLSSHDKKEGLRLDPLPEVASVLSRVPAPLVVLKPLVETQHIQELLDYFKSSRAIFLYREFRDVASSDLKLFGAKNGISNIRPIAEDEPCNWRSEHVSEEVRATVRRWYSPDMNCNDAAALFWYARNRLFFDLELDRRNDVYLCRYEDLTKDPSGMMERIYRFVGWSGDVPDIKAKVHTDSIRKGDGLELSPEVRDLCQALLDRLDRTYESREPGMRTSSIST